jgi:hypothetical protein
LQKCPADPECLCRWPTWLYLLALRHFNNARSYDHHAEQHMLKPARRLLCIFSALARLLQLIAMVKNYLSKEVKANFASSTSTPQFLF